MQPPRWRVPAIEIIYGVAAIALAMVAIGVSYVRAWPIAVDVGVRDNQFVENFSAPELGEGKTFRWTNDVSLLLLPQPPPNAPSVLRLRIQDSRIVRPQQPLLGVRAGGVDLAQIPLADRASRTYRLLVPPTERLGKSLRVELRTDTAQERENGRWLGVAVFNASLTPTRQALWLPSIWVEVCAAALGLFTYLTARMIGARRPRALLAAAGVIALVAISGLLNPQEILPFIQRLAAAAAIACLAVGLARLLVPTARVTLAGPAGRAPRARLLVPGAHLPTYLAIGAWMLMLFQLVMLWDGAPNIGPALWSAWVGAGAAVALGVGLPVWRATGGRGLPPAERRERQAQIALIVLGVAAGAHIGFNIGHAFTRQAPDFWILFKGVREWARGGSLYNLDEVMTNHFGKVFKVPPFYGMFFAPFVLTTGGEVLLFWHRVMNTLLIGAVALAWLRMWRLPARPLTAAALLIVFCFRPLFDTMSYGQIDLVLLFVLTLTLWALRERRDGLAGALVALATLFKLYPVVLLAFFVIKRQWAALWGFALGMLVFNGIAIVVMGWGMHWVYLTQVLPNIGGTTAWVENQTISGFRPASPRRPPRRSSSRGAGCAWRAR